MSSKSISKGADKWLEINHCQTEEQAIEFLKNENYKIVTLTSLETDKENYKNKSEDIDDLKKSVPITNLPLNERLALVFGNEGLGVDDLIFNAADIRAHIPMLGFVESLNISVAAAITLFCTTISDVNNKRVPKPISLEEQENLMNEWLKKDKNLDKFLKEAE